MTALAKTNAGQLATVEMFDEGQVALIRRLVAKDATDDEFALFLHICRERRLNPLLKQIYFTKYGGQSTIMTSIDGFRLTASRTGRYAGQAGPLWCGKDGKWVDVWTAPEKPFAAKVGVLVKGTAEPVWSVALASEFAGNTPKWKTMFCHMLAKCAESHALRKAFPEELSGLYSTDEVDATQPARVDVVVDNTPGAPPPEPVDEAAEQAKQEEHALAVAEWFKQVEQAAKDKCWQPDAFDAAVPRVLATLGLTDIMATTPAQRAKLLAGMNKDGWAKTRTAMDAEKAKAQ